ncbi:MAG TPA: hypothetical protein VK626_01740 [Nitrospiraceae bacterium]|nr:hypothetical protein [Nitrospiraceae bacterium]
MKVEALQQIDRDQARELWQKYQSHVHRQTPADAEIAAIYKRIAQGKTVIRALESIRVAGLGEDGCPKLAIAPAHMASAWWRTSRDSCTFGKRYPNTRDRLEVVRMDWPGIEATHQRALAGKQRRYEHEATVPLIPIHLRPKRGMQNYHILWEAEWTQRYPVDPYLLRRIGGDAWLVVAAWDLTDVERAVMSQRVMS